MIVLHANLAFFHSIVHVSFSLVGHFFHSVFSWIKHFLHSKWGAITGTVTAIASAAKAWPTISEKVEKVRDYRTLRQRIGADLYTQQDLIRATEFYIEPDCQVTDPAGQEDFRGIAPLRTPAHKALANLIDPASEQRFLILLADSGMGKTTLLLNFYARYGRRKKNFYLVPLGRPDADDLIAKVRHKSQSVLLLDAFDEDTKAISDYKGRLATLVNLSKDFSRVVMTCRTQFFETDAEIPRETGILKIAPVSAGVSRTYTFGKLYLSPFSETQVERYIKKRFPLWKRKVRKAARQIAASTADLTMRPMLLSHIPDLIASGKPYKRPTELYEAMIDAWLVRESHFVNPDGLREFSLALAVKIFGERELRGSETATRLTAQTIAAQMEVPLESWQFGGRSLLNRTADGFLKFSHRSLLEFLFIVAFLHDEQKAPKVAWTDQMKRFWWDMMQRRWENGSLTPRSLTARIRDGRVHGDLSRMARLGLRPFISTEVLGSAPGESDPLVYRYASGEGRTVAWEVRIGPLLLEKVDANSFDVVGKVGQSAAMLEPDQDNNVQPQCVYDLCSGLLWEGGSRKVNTNPGLVSNIRESNGSAWRGTEWRLPTAFEFSTLLRYSRDDSAYPQDLFDDWDCHRPVLCVDHWGSLEVCRFASDGSDCTFSRLNSAELKDGVYSRRVATLSGLTPKV